MILTLDPSIRGTGYAVVQKHGDEKEIVDLGCIKTEDKSNGSKLRDRVRRLQIIQNRLILLTEKWEIHEIVSELPSGSQSASAAWTLGACLGLIEGLFRPGGYDVQYYNQFQVKQEVFDTRSVQKEEVIEKMMETWKDPMLHDLPYKYQREAVCDALVVLETHLKGLE